jgi:fucose 4-O-acetylase-like acetyltransferase
MMNKTKLLSFEKHPVFCPPVSTDGKVAKKNSAVNYEFKVLYALGILFIVAGHCGDSGEALVPFVSLFTLGSFQIALFVFASGYFYHSQNEQAVLKTIGKKILHLLVPYYLYSALYVGILYLTHAYGFTIGETPNGYNFFVMPWLNGHSYVYNLGGWFIFPLFEVEILVLLFRKCFSFVKDGLAKDIVFLLIGVTLGLLGNELTVLGYHEGYWLMLSRISYFLPFYAIGFFYHRYLEGKLRINWFLYFLVLSLLILAVC